MRAIPKGTETPRHEQIGWRLPDIPAGGELYVNALQYLGFVDQSGMQTAPLNFAEIVAGCPWADDRDRGVIKGMSREYVRGLNMTDPFARSPLEIEGML